MQVAGNDVQAAIALLNLYSLYSLFIFNFLLHRLFRVVLATHLICKLHVDLIRLSLFHDELLNILNDKFSLRFKLCNPVLGQCDVIATLVVVLLKVVRPFFLSF